MTTIKNTATTVAPTFNVDSFLGSLTPVAQKAIRAKFTEEVTTQLAAKLGMNLTAEKEAPKADKVAKKGPGRPPKADKGTTEPKAPKAEKPAGEKRERNKIELPDGRSGKKWVEETDVANPGLKPKEIEELFNKEFDGKFKLPKGYVSVVRNQVKNAGK